MRTAFALALCVLVTGLTACTDDETGDPDPTTTTATPARPSR